MTETMTRTIKGDWYEDGYHRNRAPLIVEIEDGAAYWIDDIGYRWDRLHFDLEHGGEVRSWGIGVSFIPDAGELERVGLA